MAERADEFRVTELDRGGSRREALAKIGVGAAVIWAAPLVVTLPGSAAAVGSAQPGTTTTSTVPETTTTSTVPETTTTTTTAPPTQPEPDFDNTGSGIGFGTTSLDNGNGASNQLWQPIIVRNSGSLARLVVKAWQGTGPLSVTVHTSDAGGHPEWPAIGSGAVVTPQTWQYAEMTIDLSTPVPVTAAQQYVLVFTAPEPSGHYTWGMATTPLVPGLRLSKRNSSGGDIAPGVHNTLWLQTYVL